MAQLLFPWFKVNVMQLLMAAVGEREREAERCRDDCGLVSNSADQMTLQQKSRSVGWNLKIELTTPTIKALWSLVLVFKRLLILLLNNVLVKDCSMKQQYCLLYLKVLAFIFWCKLNEGPAGSLSRCGCSLNVAVQLGRDKCSYQVFSNSQENKSGSSVFIL